MRLLPLLPFRIRARSARGRAAGSGLPFRIRARSARGRAAGSGLPFRIRARSARGRAAGSGLALFLLAGALSSCRRSEPAAPPAAPVLLRATIVAVEGDVRVKRASANDYAPAARGAGLAVDDRIATGAAGHATLLFDDGTTAVVTPRSLVSIEPPVGGGGNGALQVESGRVDLDIVAHGDTQFRVNTPGAEAALPAREIMVVGRTPSGNAEPAKPPEDAKPSQASNRTGGSP